MATEDAKDDGATSSSPASLAIAGIAVATSSNTTDSNNPRNITTNEDAPAHDDWNDKTRPTTQPTLPPSLKPSKRAKVVSFSQEALFKDHVGDGTKVIIQEEPGIFLGPLLGRMTVSDPLGEDGGAGRVLVRGPPGSFEFDEGGSFRVSHEILKTSERTTQMIDYDNLVVQMGLLKCGHRYRVRVPVPDYWKNQEWNIAGDDERKQGEHGQSRNYGGRSPSISQSNEPCATSDYLPTHFQLPNYNFDVRIVENSLDDDLKGEIETGWTSSPSSECERYVIVTLSARRRGPYRGRFVLELTRHSMADPRGLQEQPRMLPRKQTQEHSRREEPLDRQTMPSIGEELPVITDSSMPTSEKQLTSHAHAATAPTILLTQATSNSLQNTTQNESYSVGSNELDAPNTSSSKSTTANATIATNKCIMSLQVDATIMGKDMGTPKLRNGVVCLGKIVGYDSDEETEWQGFD